ncbi:hypothetical protein CJ739_1331 [Mariniflexile rhizosphaerae]|uniref:hypothetical protein n=1 Tax=unclassified Mariniflexile TaxID=2643887 RepID=UPI000CC05024|nr:hypothetical protein [Mariniflexile sp. TRM1-10]AXP80422.1 hypothetical protein CJ739_1331 [Mariniflexile sp. TRM1-10]PLB20559.1 MAG: hypothetical protein TRG1_541 [Flavobacteriaceae bacterium FS1-H7996/R]
MEKNNTPIELHSFILSQYDIIASLTLLLDRSALSNAVKEHCGTALKVMGIIYTDLAYGTGTQLLSRKEFDTFFKSFPTVYYNNREQISIDTLTKNIKKCIETNEVVAIAQGGKKAKNI